ncbi:hypothetical protein LXA43DRAFT_1104849 [Ganoderma leucocontextum]|nr:hypothetical protein LXA43DRAFT_1104849 [Ganoderma leucocontextum]
MELYGDEVEFVLRYLSFLISVNDETNARALFERAVGKISPDKARPLWERWAQYEYMYGDLAAAQMLEKRMTKVYPNGAPFTLGSSEQLTDTFSPDPPIKRFAQRHKYGHVDSIATRDLGFVLSRGGSGGARTNGGNILLGCSDTLKSIGSDTPAKVITPTQGSSSKRASSPDHRQRCDEAPDYPSKRARLRSPAPDGVLDRDTGNRLLHRRHRSPMWERERNKLPPSRGRSKEEMEEDEGVRLPNELERFISTLPAPSAFDRSHAHFCQTTSSPWR